MYCSLPCLEPSHPNPSQWRMSDYSWADVNLASGPGPDGIPPRLLKLCPMELSPILFSIVWDSYRTASFPTLWKISTIILVSKKSRPSEPNHYRPVALTPITMKCLEKLILHTILSAVGPQLDPYQFCLQGQARNRGYCGMAPSLPPPTSGLPWQLGINPNHWL